MFSPAQAGPFPVSTEDFPLDSDPLFEARNGYSERDVCPIPKPKTRNLKPETRNFGTRDPESETPKTRNPNPETWNSKPGTREPKPETF